MSKHITITLDAKDAANIIEQYADEVLQIVAQRDELLEALREAHANAGNAESVYRITKTAIAKATGQV